MTKKEEQDRYFTTLWALASMSCVPSMKRQWDAFIDNQTQQNPCPAPIAPNEYSLEE
jgi:hypothetical protein